MDYAFFPGGNGLYDGVKATGCLKRHSLVLGSNFGCLDGFLSPDGRLRCNDERANQTWTPMLKLLGAAGIDRTECFFTNAWPFLHSGTSNLGPIALWLRNSRLSEDCKRFFLQTIAIVQPNLVIALGTGPADLLSRVWPRELSGWRNCKISNMDDFPLQEVSIGERLLVCTAITHPSMPNSWRRSGLNQHFAGEARLLRRAYESSKRPP
jgi:hypothetical protein